MATLPAGELYLVQCTWRGCHPSSTVPQQIYKSRTLQYESYDISRYPIDVLYAGVGASAGLGARFAYAS